MNKHSIEISDHAIARYYERVKKRTTEDFLNMIFSKEVLVIMAAMGSGRYRTKDGHRAVVEKNDDKTVVITII